MDESDQVAWDQLLEREIAVSRTVRSRLIMFLGLAPELVLGAVLSAGGSGYTPSSQLRASARRMQRRLRRGREVRVDVWWTDATLVPELAEVRMRTHRAILRRRFQPQADLATTYDPVNFLGEDRPNHLQNSDLMWLSVRGPEGTRYLGAETSHLPLIGKCAGWRYPTHA